MGNAIKLQKSYRFRSGAMLLPYITQNTALSTDGYSLKICYHTRVKIPVLDISYTPPPQYFVRGPCCY